LHRRIRASAMPRSRRWQRRRIPQDRFEARGPSSCSRTRARRDCSRRASGSPASSSRSPSSRSPPTAWHIPRLVDLSSAAGPRSRARRDLRKPGSRCHDPRRAAFCADPSGARSAARRLGAVGGHGHHRLGTLRAGSAPHPLYVRARRGHPQGQLEQEIRRNRLWTCGPGARRADRGDSQSLGSDALQENRRDGRASAPRPSRMTSPAASDMKESPRCSASSMTEVSW